MEYYETDLVFGVFRDEEDFRSAVEELEELEYHTGDISILMQDERRAEQLATETGTKAAEGAATGAVAGGVAGVLLGLGAAAFPGGLVVAGPAALALGTTGAVTGGIVGALVGLGIPENEASRWEERLEEGDVLIAVPSFDIDEVIDLLEDHGAEEISVISIEPSDHYQYNPWLSEHTRSFLAEERA